MPIVGHPTASPRSIRLGVDLGGTKIEAVLLRVEAEDPVQELVRLRVPTGQEDGYEGVLARVVRLIRDVAQEGGCPLETVPIGIGMPGSVRRRDGFVKNSNTICLNGRAFRRDVQLALAREVSFDNDASCFALAETALGAGRDYRDGMVFGVIMGTGVGGGVVVRGRLWPGLQGVAGEWGHHRVFALPETSHGAPDGARLRACYCGQRGCVEAYLSGPATERYYAELSGAKLGLAEIAARRNVDPNAAFAIDLFLEAFGRAVANVINILDPSVIVLGGGVSNLELLMTEGPGQVRRYVFNDELITPIVRHQLGDSAGVLGAALLGLEP